MHAGHLVARIKFKLKNKPINSIKDSTHDFGSLW